MYATTGAFLFYPLFVYIFMFVYDNGISGLGIARSMCEIMAYTILYFIIKIWYMEEFRKQGSWLSYNIEAFRDWAAFLRVFIPIGMVSFMEFSFWEI